MIKQKNISYLLMLFLMLALFSSCLKIGEYYVGLHLQPDMENSKFEPGLNVFGMIKSGPDFDTLNHRFEVHRLLDMLDWKSGYEVNDANIQLVRYALNGEESSYQLNSYGNGLYYLPEIIAAPGDVWEYSCVYDTFTVYATCTIPNEPLVDEQSFAFVDNSLMFNVLADSSAYMYSIYIIQNQNAEIIQEIPEPGRLTSVKIEPKWTITESEMLIYVFAFDKNLRQYFTTSNTFFKPNAYRPLYTTVDGGYGVFGAASSSQVYIGKR
jgi:hypothetical protein